jgi:hypothetical protein
LKINIFINIFGKINFSTEDEDLNSIYKDDDDDKSFSGLSSTWSSDTLFDKKKNMKNRK